MKIFIVLASLTLANVAWALVTPEQHDVAIKSGLKYLGEGSGADARSPRISYYLSDDSKNQNGAIEECRYIGGSLVSILNREQDDDIRLLTSSTPVHIWTAGRYDPGVAKWVWVNINRAFIYQKWVSDPSHPANPSPGADQGVTISTGDLSRYGWCINSVSKINNSYRYICQF